MTHEFDYYGNLIKFEVNHDVDRTTVNISSTQFEIIDADERSDIEFHCGMDYHEKAEQHFLKTGTYL